MGEINVFYLVVIGGVLISAFSQVLLKKSAVSEHQNVLFEILNWRVVLSYAIFVGVVFLDIIALKYGVRVKDIPILESLGYVFVPILSYLFCNEKISIRMCMAICLIIIGIQVFYL